MRSKIQAISYYLPETVLTNQELQLQNPNWNMKLLEPRVGVQSRHISQSNETALDLGEKACRKLLSAGKIDPCCIDALIFCTQSADYIMPPNACILHKKLNLQDNVLAFDFNLACSGYVYGLAITQGLVSSGIAKNILLVNADTYSKYIHPGDRAVRMLFGDAAAASLITASESSQGIIDIICATSGEYYDKFIIPAGGCRMPKTQETNQVVSDRSGNKRTLENIHMDGMGILAFINIKVAEQIKFLLKRNHLVMNDISLLVLHQASKVALDSLVELLHTTPEKIFYNLNDIGNTVSASIPIALKDALETKRIKSGDKILLSGFGVGLSWASAIMEI